MARTPKLPQDSLPPPPLGHNSGAASLETREGAEAVGRMIGGLYDRNKELEAEVASLEQRIAALISESAAERAQHAQALREREILIDDLRQRDFESRQEINVLHVDREAIMSGARAIKRTVDEMNENIDKAVLRDAEERRRAHESEAERDRAREGGLAAIAAELEREADRTNERNAEENRAEADISAEGEAIPRFLRRAPER